jgi:hypothetical protein
LEEGSAGFVVQDMCVWGGVAAFESFEKGGVCSNAMGVSFGLERLHQDGVGFAV